MLRSEDRSRLLAMAEGSFQSEASDKPKEPKLGTGERFKKLVKKLAAQGAEDPKALAAYIGRKKYGAKKFQKLAAAGRARHASEAAGDDETQDKAEAKKLLTSIADEISGLLASINPQSRATALKATKSLAASLGVRFPEGKPMADAAKRSRALAKGRVVNRLLAITTMWTDSERGDESGHWAADINTVLHYATGYRFFKEAVEAKLPTFPEARDALLKHLLSKGWKVAPALKIPHATSPDGETRLWFKAQAVYFTHGNRHEFGGARSLHSDIRAMSPEAFVADAMKFAARAEAIDGARMGPLAAESVQAPEADERWLQEFRERQLRRM